MSLAVLQPVGAGPEDLCDDEGALPWWGELMAPPVVLPEAENEVIDAERAASDSPAVVSTYGL